MKNPFSYGQVVSGSFYLERPEPEKFIHDAIENNQNIFITGMRRSGKTSTTIHVIQSESKKYYIHADFFGVRSQGDVAKKIVNAISLYKINHFGLDEALKSLARFRVKAETRSDGSGFDIVPYLKEEQYIEDIEAALGMIQEITKKKKVAVFFDEFQEISKIRDHEAILGKMRSVIQFMKNTAFIFAGSIRHQMDHIFRDPGSAFYKSALPLDFPKIDKGRMYEFVKKRMKKKNITFPHDIFARLYDVTDGIAGDIQQFCRTAFAILEEDVGLDDKHYQHVMREIFKQEEKFYKYTLYESSHTKLQIDVLVTLAQHPELGHQSQEFKKIANNYNSNSIETALQSLIKHNLIYKDEKNIKFFNPFFREWLKGGTR